jgi:acetolactate synthase-1/2/3 large subunit
MKISGSEIFIKSLVQQGVELIFGYPGGANMPIYDVLLNYTDKIRHILTRHEQGAVHAAEGYARIKRKAGVCLVTSGPGATNLVTGIADAMMDSVPLVCITGQVAASLIGTDAFQETDIIGITAPITKWNYQITRADEVAEVVAKAFYIAQTGRPGPVLIDFAKNAQIETAEYQPVKNIFIESYQPNYHPNLLSIKKAAQLINSAEKPLVLAGHGIIIGKAEELLKQFVEKGNLPVAVTLHGISSIPTDHRLYAGFLGMHGNYAPNILTNQSDLLIALGMRFDDRVTGRLDRYGKKAKIIHIDIDPAEINKNVKADVPIVADVGLALKQLIKLVKPKERDQWLMEFKKHDVIERNKIIDPLLNDKRESMTMAYVINKLSQITDGKSTIVADVGQNQMTAARYYQFKKMNSFITSGGLGTMGYAMPAAIGAKLARFKDTVIAVVGDGGIQMVIQELGTIKQERLPVKILLLNNQYLGMVRQWQDLFFQKRRSFTYMVNPDFIELAKSYAIKAKKVDKKEKLEESLKEFVSVNEPYLLEVIVEKEEFIFPMVPAGAALDEIRLE